MIEEGAKARELRRARGSLERGERQEIAARFPSSQANRRALRLQAQVAAQARRMRLETPEIPRKKCACKRISLCRLAACGSKPLHRSARVRSRRLLALAKKNRPEDGFLIACGGGGGNRTRVRKHSTDSSTYLALSFNLTGTTRMCTLCTS